MTDFCVNCGNKELALICVECHHKVLKLHENRQRAEFLKDLEGIDQPDVAGTTMESMNDQVEEVHNKWDKE